MSMSLKETTTIVWNHFMKTVRCFMFSAYLPIGKMFKLRKDNLPGNSLCVFWNG